MIRFEHTYAGKDPITMVISGDDETLAEAMAVFKKFVMAIGYAEETFNEVCKEMAEEE